MATSPDRAALARQAAPPDRRLWVPWTIVAVAAGGAALSRVLQPDALFAGALMIAVLAIVFATRARNFNTRHFPILYQRWQRSFLCSRCGQIFVSAA